MPARGRDTVLPLPSPPRAKARGTSPVNGGGSNSLAVGDRAQHAFAVSGRAPLLRVRTRLAVQGAGEPGTHRRFRSGGQLLAAPRFIDGERLVEFDDDVDRSAFERVP